MSSSMMESSTPQTVIINDYKMALKFFINKDFGKSFLIILKLHEISYQNFDKGMLDEEVFIKIVTLYLTEIGLLLNPRETVSSFQLPRLERKELLKKLENSAFLDSLYSIYGSITEIPSELLFQIFLVNYTCQNLIRPEDPRHLLKQFQKLYPMLATKTNDRYMKRLIDMYVFNVLPDADEFETAFLVVRENPLFETATAKAKLEEIQILRKHEKNIRDKQIKERDSKEAKVAEEEKAKKKASDERKNLKYMSLKQIKKEHESEEPSKKLAAPRPESSFTVEQFKARLTYLLQLSKNIIQKNSPVILVVILLAFFSTRYLRTRKINLKDKLRETLLMAFKITYL